MKVQRFYLMLCAIVLGSMLVGCATAAKPTLTPTAGLVFPFGVFTSQSAGGIIEFREAGTFTVNVPGGSGLGTYTLNGDQITVKGTAEDWCGERVTGTYTWAYDGKSLTLTGYNDVCGDRWGVFVNGPWIKSP